MLSYWPLNKPEIPMDLAELQRLVSRALEEAADDKNAPDFIRVKLRRLLELVRIPPAEHTQRILQGLADTVEAVIKTRLLSLEKRAG